MSRTTVNRAVKGKLMTILKPTIVEIAYRTWCINEFGMNSMYLLEGDEQALLIDVGTGGYDTPSLIKQLTDKPLIVAITHGHVDHAGGMGLFDTVHMHIDDTPRALSITDSEREYYVKTMLDMPEDIYAVDPDDAIVFKKMPKLIPLNEGETIRLGNRDVEVYETPGHTPGVLSFLDRKERLLFTGDACFSTILLGYSEEDMLGPKAKSSISDILHTANKLYSLRECFDRHYNGHAGEATDVNILPLPTRIFKDIIELCEGLLDGSIQGKLTPPDSFYGEHLEAGNGLVTIAYKPWHVR